MPSWYKIFICFTFVTALIFQSFTLFYISRTYAKAQQSLEEITKFRQEPSILYTTHPDEMTEITESAETEPEPEPEQESYTLDEPAPETTESVDSEPQDDNNAHTSQNIEEIPDDSPPLVEPSGESPKQQQYFDDLQYPDYDTEIYENSGVNTIESELLYQILLEIKIIQYITIFAHSCVLIYILYKPIVNILR